jgi:stress response protein YsnF
MESSTFGHITDWNDVIKKETKGRNDADLGEVLEVKDDIVITERGTLSKEKFYLPKSIPHGFNGHTLLFDITEEEAKERFMNDPASTQGSKIQSTTTTSSSTSTTATADVEKPIPVIEEKLELSKKETIQEAKVIKKPRIDFKTVEVELTHEELIIEKRQPAQSNTSSSSTSSTITTSSSTTTTTTSTTPDIAQTKTEISIPLKREDVIVSKKPHVKEEIVIKKKPVTETKTISEQLITEKVSIRNPAGEEVTEQTQEKEGDREERGVEGGGVKVDEKELQ